MSISGNSDPAGGPSEADVVVIGAGLSGLMAARTLRPTTGASITILDKGRSVGGRLATRRIDEARLDHGAQFFTVRGDDLAAAIAPLAESGLVTEWCRGFNETDGYPRYAVQGGMNRLAKHWAADLDITTGATVSAVERIDEGWRITGSMAGDGGHAFSIVARAVVATAPVPQTLALLDAGSVTIPPAVDTRLRDMRYHKVLALLVTLDGPSAVPPPGGCQLESGPFSFIGDNLAKGASKTSAVTFHASHGVSEARWDDDHETVRTDLLADAGTWLGASPVRSAQLKTWRYAGPVACWPDPVCDIGNDDHPFLLAGDAFAGPKFEGAFNSGVAAGRTLIERLPGV